MFANFKFLISFFILITLLTIREIPYVNIVIKDKLWVAGIISYVILAILFTPSNFLVRYRKANYLIIAYIFTILVLLIFTLVSVPILSELFGTILYGLFWVLAIYKILALLKSPSEPD